MGTKTATVRGVPMRWEEHGEGVPAVLVHGIPTSPALWRHVVPRLSNVPARVVWGAADRFQKVHYGARLAWDLNTELERIEGGPTGHPKTTLTGSSPRSRT